MANEQDITTAPESPGESNTRAVRVPKEKAPVEETGDISEAEDVEETETDEADEGADETDELETDEESSAPRRAVKKAKAGKRR